MKKREKLSFVHKYNPDASTTVDSDNKLIDFIENQLDIETTKVMMADRVSNDDVNSIHYSSRAQEFLGPFKLGGLDDFPLTGLTGMGASFICNTIVLVDALLINRNSDIGSYSQTKRFDVIDQKSKTRRNYINEFTL